MQSRLTARTQRGLSILRLDAESPFPPKLISFHVYMSIPIEKAKKGYVLFLKNKWTAFSHPGSPISDLRLHGDLAVGIKSAANAASPKTKPRDQAPGECQTAAWLADDRRRGDALVLGPPLVFGEAALAAHLIPGDCPSGRIDHGFRILR